MADGLKEHFGLNDPASGGSNKQANAFKRDFKSGVKQPDTDLGYLASHAPMALYGALDGDRGKLYGAYQKTLKAVDPQDPRKASGKIKQVLTAVDVLQKKAVELRRTTETSHAAWKAAEPQYNTAASQTEELDEWGLEGCAGWLSQSGEVAKAAANRQWSEAKAALDRLIGDIAAPYQEYQRQKAAKQEYDREKPSFDSALAALGSPPEPSNPMAALFASVVAQPPLMLTWEAQKNYVEALGLLRETAPQLDELTQLAGDPDRAAFLAQHPGLADSVGQCRAVPDPFVQPRLPAITDGETKAHGQAAAGQYANALTTLGEAQAACDEFLRVAAENAEARAQWEAEHPGIELRVTSAEAAPEPSVPMTAAQEATRAALQAAQALAAESNYIEAYPQLQAAQTALEELETLTNDPQRIAYLTGKPLALAAAGGADAIEDPFVEPLRGAYREQADSMQSSAEAGDYGTAVSASQACGDAANACIAKAEENKAAKTDYTKLRAAFDPRHAASDSYPEPSKPMLDKKAQIAPALAAAETQVGTHNYIDALSPMEGCGTLIDELDGMACETNRMSYLSQLPQAQGLRERADASAPPWMEPQKLAYQSLFDQMQAAATLGDYAAALAHLSSVIEALQAFIATVTENTAKKSVYETERRDLDKRFEIAKALPEPSVPMTALLEKVAKALELPSQLAGQENYIGALENLQEATRLLADLEALGGDPDRQAYLRESGPTASQMAVADGIQNPSLEGLREPYRTAGAGIAGAAQKGDYGTAVSSLSAAGAATEAFMAEAAKDTEAKLLYDPARQALAAEIEQLAGAPEPSDPMAAEAQESRASLGQAEAKATNGDYDGALSELEPVKLVLERLRGLANDPDRQAFLACQPALVAALEGAKAASAAVGGRLSKALEGLGRDELDSAAKAGDYGQARSLLDAVIERGCEVQRLQEVVTRYDEAETGATRRLAEGAVLPVPSEPMEDLQQRCNDELGSAKALADSQDFDGALAALEPARAAADELFALGMDPQRLTYLGLGSSVTAMAETIPTSLPAFIASLRQPLAAALDAMTGAARAGDYGEAVSQGNQANEAVATCLAKLQENEAAKSEYDKARQAFDLCFQEGQGQPEPSDPMAALAGRVREELGAVEQALADENYPQALEALKTPRASAEELKALAFEGPRIAYLGTKPLVMGLLSQTRTVEDPFCAADKAALKGVQEGTEASARAGDYGQALAALETVNQQAGRLHGQGRGQPPSPGAPIRRFARSSTPATAKRWPCPSPPSR